MANGNSKSCHMNLLILFLVSTTLGLQLVMYFRRGRKGKCSRNGNGNGWMRNKHRMMNGGYGGGHNGHRGEMMYEEYY